MHSADVERLTTELTARRRLHDTLVLFSRGVAARSTLGTALESLAADLVSVLPARRAAVWLHDREARKLTLTGSSEPADLQPVQEIATTDDSPIATILRQEQPELSGDGGHRTLCAPLRGWRRALGVLVIDLAESDLPDEQLLSVVRDFAAQLSIALENIAVLHDAIGRKATRPAVPPKIAPADKLAALGQFIAGIAHELNNPLQGVLGHVELLIATAPNGSTLRADLKRVYADADRAAKIVRNLLVFAGSRRATKRRIDVARLVARAVALRDTTPPTSRVEFVQRCDPGLPGVLGDAGLLQQALLNVVVNAEQAVADSTGTGRVTVAARAADGRVLITVEDTGPGIHPDAMGRIFDPFFTTKELGKGTGLGLAITSGIIQDHGGSITAGEGTRAGALFTIELPAAE